jgi:pimeloyl-ACP methyl ester carboxylesterase
MDTLSLGPAVLVGYSMGGPVTQLVCRDRPDLVVGLGQIATAAHIIPSRVSRLGLSTGGRTLGVALEASRSVERVVGSRVHHGGPTSLAGHGRWLAGASNKRSLTEAARELASFDSRSWVDDLDIPACVAVTAKDRAVPPEAQRELADLLQAASFEVADGHIHCLDEHFDDTVTDVVNQADGGR